MMPIESPKETAPILSVDIGGTHFRMALLDPSGEILSVKVLATNTVTRASEALLQLRDTLDPSHSANEIVVGVPGIVDYIEQCVLHAPNIPQDFLSDLSRSSVRQTLEIEATIINDADLAAVGEAYFGAGRNETSFCYATISTGVGAAVISEGKLLRTRFSIAEIGHTYLDIGLAQVTGEGSVEFMASGTAMHSLARGRGLDVDNETLLRQDLEGDAASTAILGEVTSAAGVALVNLVHMFSAELIIIGGGLGLAEDSVFELISETFLKLAPPYLAPRIKKADLGDRAGLHGAPWARVALGLT